MAFGTVNKNLPSTTLGLIVACSVAVIGLVSAGLLPKYFNIGKIRQANLEKKIALEEQKNYYPLWAMAKKLGDTSFQPGLSLPDRKPVPRNDIPGVMAAFESIAVKTDLTLTGTSIDMASLKKSDDTITLQLFLTGGLDDFRKFLVQSAALAFFDTVVSIDISAEDGPIKRFHTTIKLNVDNA